MRVIIPFVAQSLAVDIPEANLLFDVSPLATPPATDFEAVIVSALQQPIGTEPLKDLVHPKMRVVLICDDNTRPTPVDRIIPILLDFLNQAGIQDANVEIVISSGTHRAMTPDEIENKYSRRLIERVKIYPHDYKDRANLVDFGVTRRGTPILVNRRVVEADFRITVGNIVPHHPAGWSGGAKAVLPGVAGEETVARMHLLGSKYPALGEIDSQMRGEMEDFAGRIGLNFILNVILNRDGDLVAAVAGDFIAAHRKGVAISRKVYGVEIPALADLTISSTSPVDFDFFQGDKGITSAERATRPGGRILLLSGCLEGVSPAHPELGDYVGRVSNARLWEQLGTEGVPDPLTAAEAIVINDILAKMSISIVSQGLSPELCRSMGMVPVSADNLDDYLRGLILENPAIKIGILRKSADILPVLKQGE